MPTYEYRCPSGHDFEHFFRKISDSQSELPCPVCGAAAERRISGGAGLLFKGAGFYITDYGKDGKKDQKAASSAKSGDGASAAGSGAKGGEAKGDSKGGGESAAAAKPASSSPSTGGSSSSSSGGDS